MPQLKCIVLLLKYVVTGQDYITYCTPLEQNVKKINPRSIFFFFYIFGGCFLMADST